MASMLQEYTSSDVKLCLDFILLSDNKQNFLKSFYDAYLQNFMMIKPLVWNYNQGVLNPILRLHLFQSIPRFG